MRLKAMRNKMAKHIAVKKVSRKGADTFAILLTNYDTSHHSSWRSASVVVGVLRCYMRGEAENSQELQCHC